MCDTGLVPLYYHPDVAVMKKVVKSCYDGGVRVFEFTSRGDLAMRVFEELRKFATDTMPELALGIGSVTDGSAAAYYIQLGADFIVTPVFREDVARICNRRKILWSPGCMTLSDIADAEELGCELIKVFPAEVLGPAFIKAVKAPQPWTNIMPTGGVSPTEKSLTEWFQAGASCVGIGSQLISNEVVQTGNYSSLQQKSRFAIHFIQEFKNRPR